LENVKLFLRKTIQLLESLFRKDVLNILIHTTVLCKRFSDNWNVEQKKRNKEIMVVNQVNFTK
jgi:hypothetical protein